MRRGTVRVLVIEPKGGMEFGRGQQLFSGFAYDNGERTLALLRAAATVRIGEQNGYEARAMIRTCGWFSVR